MKNPSFYMSTYLIDAICVANRFPTFNWAWSLDQILIHAYCFQLWKVKCKEYFYDICDYFLLLYTRPSLISPTQDIPRSH
jgi:hypothetical protein